MKLKTRMQDSVLILEVKGKVMGGPDATVFQDTIKSEISNGNKKFIFDLGGVDWMNSSGLGILIGGLSALRKSGGDLRLSSVTEKIDEVLRITKLDKVFDIYSTTDEAVASYES